MKEVATFNLYMLATFHYSKQQQRSLLQKGGGCFLYSNYLSIYTQNASPQSIGQRFGISTPQF